MVHWLRTYRFGSEPRLRTEVMIDLGYVVHMHMLKYMMLATHARVGCTFQCMFEYSRKYIVDIMDHFNVISEMYAYLSETRCTGDCKAYAVWCIKLLGTWSTALRGVEYTSAMMEISGMIAMFETFEMCGMSMVFEIIETPRMFGMSGVSGVCAKSKPPVMSTVSGFGSACVIFLPYLVPPF